MSTINAYPPVVLHPTVSGSLDLPSAHTLLTDFLHLANLDPAYHPDSTLTERGPQSNSTTGNPNLTLHHLNRIKLGLEGKNLGAETLDGEEKETGLGAGKKRKRHDRDPCAEKAKANARARNAKVVSNEDGDAILTTQNADTQQSEEGWQDREDFELAQDDEDVDVNNAQRDPAAEDVDMDMDMEEGIMEKTARIVHVDQGEKRVFTQREKEERKRKKRMRWDEGKKTGHREKARGPKKSVKTGDDKPAHEEERQRRRKKKKSKVQEE